MDFLLSLLFGLQVILYGKEPVTSLNIVGVCTNQVIVEAVPPY